MRSPEAGRGDGARHDFANGNRIEVKVSGEQSEGRITLIEGTHAPHTGPPLHIHDAVDELFYVLEGTYAITCGDTVLATGLGDSVLVPRGTPHRFEPGAAGGRMLLLYIPGGFDRYFTERHQEERRLARPLDREELEALGRRHCMRLAD